MIDIIILTHNHIEDTKKCIESIKTNFNYNLIIIDDSSNDGTVEYAHSKGAKVIPTGGDFNFSRNVNIGVKFGSSPLKLICNNDIEFTDGAIDKMVEVMYSEPKIGLVGPCSNGVMNPEQKVMRSHSCKTTRTLNFFCILIDHKVFESIGYMDKRFDGYGCDDDDFCLRAYNAGFDMMIAPVLVRHNATTTYKETNKKVLFNNNIEKFKAKWGVGPARDWKKVSVA
jgi:GT2 family glycosyltransferase